MSDDLVSSDYDEFYNVQEWKDVDIEDETDSLIDHNGNGDSGSHHLGQSISYEKLIRFTPNFPIRG